MKIKQFRMFRSRKLICFCAITKALQINLLKIYACIEMSMNDWLIDDEVEASNKFW